MKEKRSISYRVVLLNMLKKISNRNGDQEVIQTRRRDTQQRCVIKVIKFTEKVIKIICSCIFSFTDLKYYTHFINSIHKQSPIVQ